MNSMHKINEEYLDLIISVAYGDASLTDKIKVYREARKNPAVKKLLNEYRETADAVKNFEQEECPEELYVKALEANNINKSGIIESVILFINGIFKKPAVSFAFTVLILGGLAALLLINKPAERQSQYSKAEIVKAEKEAKQSLALVSKIFKTTQDRLTDQILPEQVARPVKESMNIINDLFKGGS